MALLHFQIQNTPVFGEYLRLIDQQWDPIEKIDKIQFLPVRFFKSHEVYSSKNAPSKVFLSSSTSGKGRSKHMIEDLKETEEVSEMIFAQNFGALKNYRILGLLPNYLEQGDSSLVHMVGNLIKASENDGGFFLSDHDSLAWELKGRSPTILYGVSFALLDFIKDRSIDHQDLIVIETGGMKGRKKEITREELHAKLGVGFPRARLVSEYGMTELVSHAYSNEDGIFTCPPWMKVMIRDDTDPLTLKEFGKGALNIIDLANRSSCAFLATDDLAEVYRDGSFRILGRLDDSDVRGCSLLV